jgi:hypothetical protein
VGPDLAHKHHETDKVWEYEVPKDVWEVSGPITSPQYEPVSQAASAACVVTIDENAKYPVLARAVYKHDPLDTSIFLAGTYEYKTLLSRWYRDIRPRVRLGYDVTGDKTHLSQILSTIKEDLEHQQLIGMMCFEVDYRRGLERRTAAYKQSVIEHWRASNQRTSVSQLFFDALQSGDAPPLARDRPGSAAPAEYAQGGEVL